MLVASMACLKTKIPCYALSSDFSFHLHYSSDITIFSTTTTYTVTHDRYKAKFTNMCCCHNSAHAALNIFQRVLVIHGID